MTFSVNDLGIAFRSKLINCIDDSDFDVSTITSSYIVFYKPDGIKFSKAAILEEVPVGSGEYDVTYHNDSPEKSILDISGPWEYTARIITSTKKEFESTQRELFWVIG